MAIWHLNVYLVLSFLFFLFRQAENQFWFFGVDLVNVKGLRGVWLGWIGLGWPGNKWKETDPTQECS
jgi:hypothetical protein